MSKNVHSEEEWDILSDPEEAPNKIEENKDVINENDEITISIKESGEKKEELDELEKIEIILDSIEKETEKIEHQNKTIQQNTEQKNLIDEQDPFCACLMPYLNTNNIRKQTNNCEIL
tara:strand:+ start:560 stop:913 length:354 start_codon:yes stop_codon:yes gene_type:complete